MALTNAYLVTTKNLEAFLNAVQSAKAPAVVNKLADAMRASLKKPETRERLRALGANSVGSSPAEFARWLEQDFERWTKLIKAAGVKGG